MGVFKFFVFLNKPGIYLCFESSEGNKCFLNLEDEIFFVNRAKI